jgi:siroheme decarboxylase
MNELDQQLLNDFQRDFPLSPRPYAELAARLNCTEAEVLERLQVLQEQNKISRIGAIIKPHTVGTSTLAAMAVPDTELERVAQQINAFAEVNHNYEREHELNLWFVATAENEAHLSDVLKMIERQTGYTVVPLPLIEDYHIDLGFDLKCSR